MGDAAGQGTLYLTLQVGSSEMQLASALYLTLQMGSSEMQLASWPEFPADRAICLIQSVPEPTKQRSTFCSLLTKQ